MPPHANKESGKPPWSKNLPKLPKNFKHGFHPYESNIVLALPAIPQYPTHNGKANEPPIQCLDDDNCILEEPCTQMQNMPILNPSPPKCITIEPHVFQTMVEMGFTNFLLDGPTEFLKQNNPFNSSQPLVISVDQNIGELTSPLDIGENSTKFSMASPQPKNSSKSTKPPKKTSYDFLEPSDPKSHLQNRMCAPPTSMHKTIHYPPQTLPKTSMNDPSIPQTHPSNISSLSHNTNVDQQIEMLTLPLDVETNPKKNSMTSPIPKNNSTSPKPPSSTSLDFIATSHPKTHHANRIGQPPPSDLNPSIQNSPTTPTIDLSHFPPLPSSSQTTSHPNPNAATTTSQVPTNTPPPPFAKPNTYLSLFKDNRQPCNEHTLDMEKEEELLCIEEDDMLTVEEAWGHSLIGFLVGAVPSTRIVRDLIKGWKVPCKFSFHRNDWVVFEFEDREAKKRVQEMGSHSSLGRSWIIREVPKLFTFSDSCFASVPIWVNLRCLPKQLWSRKALSKIASQIGRPVCTDKITGERSFHDCARILVEVDVTKEPKKVLPIKMPDGRMWDQPLEYEVQPVICSKCRSLGHSDADCQGRRSAPPRRPDAAGRGRSTSKNPVPKVVKTDKGKKVAEDKTVTEERATPTLPSSSKVARSPGVVIREPVDKRKGMNDHSIVQAATPVSSPPTRRQTETTTPRVETPNPFGVLAGLESRSGTTRAVIQIEEEEETPMQIQALLDDAFSDDDLLDDEGIDEIEDQADEISFRIQGGRQRRRRAGAQ